MSDISISGPKPQDSKLLDPIPGLGTVQTTLDKFLTAANVEAVYGPPVTQGENLVIPAAEVLSVVDLAWAVARRVPLSPKTPAAVVGAEAAGAC